MRIRRLTQLNSYGAGHVRVAVHRRAIVHLYNRKPPPPILIRPMSNRRLPDRRDLAASGWWRTGVNQPTFMVCRRVSIPRS